MPESTVLFVDDEPNILRTLQRLCRREDFTVLTAGHGEEALAMLQDTPAQVIVSDFRMPEMNGIEFLARAKEIVPDSIRMILSGFADASTIVEAINKGEVYRFLGKPWDDGELLATIHQALDHFSLRRRHHELVLQTEHQNEQLRLLNENLESIVEERTCALSFAQQVLEHLPVAVMGVSREGEIMLTNAHLASRFLTLAGITPGSEVEEALPPDIATTIRESMADRGDRHYECALGDEGIALTVVQLGTSEHQRGCLVVFAPGEPKE